MFRKDLKQHNNNKEKIRKNPKSKIRSFNSVGSQNDGIAEWVWSRVGSSDTFEAHWYEYKAETNEQGRHDRDYEKVLTNFPDFYVDPESFYQMTNTQFSTEYVTKWYIDNQLELPSTPDGSTEVPYRYQYEGSNYTMSYNSLIFTNNIYIYNDLIYTENHPLTYEYNANIIDGAKVEIHDSLIRQIISVDTYTTSLTPFKNQHLTVVKYCTQLSKIPDYVNQIEGITKRTESITSYHIALNDDEIVEFGIMFDCCSLHIDKDLDMNGYQLLFIGEAYYNSGTETNPIPSQTVKQTSPPYIAGTSNTALKNTSLRINKNAGKTFIQLLNLDHVNISGNPIQKLLIGYDPTVFEKDYKNFLRLEADHILDRINVSQSFLNSMTRDVVFEEGFEADETVDLGMLDNGYNNNEFKALIYSEGDTNSPLMVNGGYLAITANNGIKNGITFMRRTLHEDLKAYSSDLSAQEYLKNLAEDLNKGKVYSTESYPTIASYKQWISECQIKCTKGIIMYKKYEELEPITLSELLGGIYNTTDGFEFDLNKLSIRESSTGGILHQDLELYEATPMTNKNMEKVILNDMKYGTQNVDASTPIVGYTGTDLIQWIFECQAKATFKILIKYKPDTNNNRYYYYTPDYLYNKSNFELQYVTEVYLLGWLPGQSISLSYVNSKLDITDINDEYTGSLLEITEVNEKELTLVGNEVLAKWWLQVLRGYVKQMYPSGYYVYAIGNAIQSIRWPLDKYIYSDDIIGKRITVVPSNSVPQATMHVSMDEYVATSDKTVEEVIKEDIELLTNTLVTKPYNIVYADQWFAECATKYPRQFKLKGNAIWKSNGTVISSTGIDERVNWALKRKIENSRPNTSANLELEINSIEIEMSESTSNFLHADMSYYSVETNPLIYKVIILNDIISGHSYTGEDAARWLSECVCKSVFSFILRERSSRNYVSIEEAIIYLKNNSNATLQYYDNILLVGPVTFIEANTSDPTLGLYKSNILEVQKQLTLIEPPYVDDLKYILAGASKEKLMKQLVETHTLSYNNLKEMFSKNLYITQVDLDEQNFVLTIPINLDNTYGLKTYPRSIEYRDKPSGNNSQYASLGEMKADLDKATDYETIFGDYARSYQLISYRYLTPFYNDQTINEWFNDCASRYNKRTIYTMKFNFYADTQNLRQEKNIGIESFKDDTSFVTIKEITFEHELNGNYVHDMNLFINENLPTPEEIIEVLSLSSDVETVSKAYVSFMGYKVTETDLKEAEIAPVEEFFNTWRTSGRKETWSEISALQELENILSNSTDLNNLKREINRWQYKAMYLNYVEDSEPVFMQGVPASNVTFKITTNDEKEYYIDDILTAVELPDFSNIVSIEPTPYKISRGSEPTPGPDPEEEGYILTDADQEETDGWTYTDLINDLMNEYIDDPDMSNSEVSNIMTLIETRLTSEEEKAISEDSKELQEIVEDVKEVMNMILTHEQDYPREDVMSSYTREEIERIREVFEAWKKYYTLSAAEYIARSTKMIWEEIIIDFFNNYESVDPQLIIDYYNTIEKNVNGKTAEWTSDLDDDGDEDEEEALQIMPFADATDEEYQEMMMEIQGARNNLQRNDSNRRLIVIQGTDYGDLYSVFAKEGTKLPVETYFRVRHSTSDSPEGACHTSCPKEKFKDLVYIPIDRTDADTVWTQDQWLLTDLYQYLFYPMYYYINDSSPFKGLIASNTSIRYLGYLTIKEKTEGQGCTKQ